MSDQTRGITCPDMRRVVREALAAGWEWAGWSGTTHAQIRWPKSGVVLRFGSTPSVASWKTLATDIKRESGVEVWRKGNRKRSRKTVERSGFSLGRASSESARWHEAWDEKIAHLWSERDALIADCRKFAAERGRMRLIPRRLERIADIEAALRDMNQPVEPFDPYSLADTA